jgi:hypothetical protein
MRLIAVESLAVQSQTATSTQGSRYNRKAPKRAGGKDKI